MRYSLLPLLILFLSGSTPQSIPVTHAQSLAGTQVSLPSDLGGKVGVLVLGFSKKSSSETKGWGDAIFRDFQTDPHVAYYQMPVLADVPSLVRGLVIQGIRKQIDPALRLHFVPILQDAAAWKEVVQFAAPDDAYIVLLDSGGKIQWRTHGMVNGEVYSRMKRCVTELTSKEPDLIAGCR